MEDHAEVHTGFIEYASQRPSLDVEAFCNIYQNIQSLLCCVNTVRKQRITELCKRFVSVFIECLFLKSVFQDISTGFWVSSIVTFTDLLSVFTERY